MTDVLIVGAGPAGLAAAVRCAENGRNVTLLDDNPTIGGQIWRGGPAVAKDRTASKWFHRVQSKKNISFLNARVIAANAATRRLTVESLEGASVITWRTLILATGAREIFLPFPGWTLPGVFGVGGLQALAKSGFPIANKRIVVAGSGPLLLAAASYFQKHGAIIRTIAEQAPWPRLVQFSAKLLCSPTKLLQALQLRASLQGASYRPGTWVTRAEGNGRLQRVSLTNGRRTWTEDCDYAAVAYGLWPNTELASLLGCRLDGKTVAVDDHGRTSIAHIFCAGEATGIGGLELSLLEGEIAGFAAGDLPSVTHRLRQRDRAKRFARHLDHAFALRPQIKALSDADTIVCRCEDVTLARLQSSSSWREAKLHTRCGMGPCQGRICGPAVSILFGWQASSVRPPVFPARIASLLEQTSSGDNRKNMKMQWRGVLPAITTPFKEDLSIDHEFLAKHARWLVESGCAGIVALGSLGEGATLANAEKEQVLKTCIDAVGDRVPVVAGVSSLSTADAVAIAETARKTGCSGLMVLPPYVYLGDWRETKAHVSSILSATDLSCMLYNNPIAYRVDFLPEHVGELLGEHPNLHSIKESSADVRRVTALRAIAGERLQILCGVDDAIVEAVQAGAVGWIAGLVNAYPKESVELFNLAVNGLQQEAFSLYRWFLPLLRMDTVPKFVQLIKLAQEQMGMGSRRVRPPRLELTGAELREAMTVFSTAHARH